MPPLTHFHDPKKGFADCPNVQNFEPRVLESALVGASYEYSNTVTGIQTLNVRI